MLIRKVNPHVQSGLWMPLVLQGEVVNASCPARVMKQENWL